MGEREAHGNSTIAGDYVLRVATQAAREGRSVAIRQATRAVGGWQRMSGADVDAESAYTGLVKQLTVGRWSA